MSQVFGDDFVEDDGWTIPAGWSREQDGQNGKLHCDVKAGESYTVSYQVMAGTDGELCFITPTQFTGQINCISVKEVPREKIKQPKPRKRGWKKALKKSQRGFTGG